MGEKEAYIIALDVGGSYIKSTILSSGIEMIPATYEVFPSKASESKEEILNHFLSIILKQLKKVTAPDRRLLGIGFAFPGPFDYENGISYIRGIDKYDHLYGVNLREALMKRINQEKIIVSKSGHDLLMIFANDAHLFAFGEAMYGKGKDFDRSMYLTIGTGAGSAFISHGQIIKEGNALPENGWIYKEPFKASIIDDYISKRGIAKLAKESGVHIRENEIKSLARMADHGHEKAREVFYTFGQYIGEALLPYVTAFDPEALILGGQISKSMHLFLDGIDEKIDQSTVLIDVTNDTSISTFHGIGALLKQSKESN